MVESYGERLERLVREALARGDFDRLGTAQVVPWRHVIKEPPR